MMPDETTCLSIAIVEDDAVLREELGNFLKSHGHTVHELVSGTALDDLIQEVTLDIVILDLNLPGQSGFEIAKHYRQGYPELGIIILSARSATVDRIESYEQGADIYIRKPCAPDELLAAVRSLSRRVKTSQSPNAWQLDPIRNYLVKSNGSKSIQLLAVEAAIIDLLARAHKNQLSTEDLCILVPQSGPNNGSPETLTKRALENKISRIRKKFAREASSEPLLIRSIRGEGYQLCVPVTVLPANRP
ncbi:MAG: response regulator transcription factor [Orrella sp.]